ncbi:MAG: ABC-F family ATP-binding cassette domain-containing protein [Desulfobacteraceae bacterium]|jgi:ATP-binding cassette subfamily F protein 3
MSLVNIIDLTHGYSGRFLFEHVHFQVEAGDKIGLVGPNGSGKTTLLRLLSGETTPEAGTIRISEGTRIGYLAQDVLETQEDELLRSLLGSVPGRARLERQARQKEADIENGTRREEQEKLAAELAEIHLEMHHLDARYPRHEAEKILVGLGFSESDFTRPISALSGGWKMRAALAGLLYRKPDLMLLDEPTNHLDIPSVRWLEQFLDGYRGALVLVSHDRDFLNRRIQRVVSFEEEGLRFYTGDYDTYVMAREEERKTLENRARNQEMKVKEAQRFIERFRSKATKARQAQSKLKLVRKMELVNTHRRSKKIRFHFPEVPRSGRVVASIEGVSKRYGEHVLYDRLDLKILRGERIALIGPNGSGKTTLLKMVEGEVEPDEGRIQLGHGVVKSYYAQHHSDMLDARRTVLEEVYRVVPHESVSVVRGVCGAFLFPGEDVDKAVGVLSGGEKARVCLARILVKPGNFLVMDEPTNHLDLISSEILIEALRDFSGTLLFVSHNQAFINRLATKIWDLRSGELMEYPGTLEDYYAQLERAESGDFEAPNDIQATDTEERSTRNRKEIRRERAEQRRRVQKKILPLETSLRRIEEQIQELEARQKELEQALVDPELFRDESRSVPILKEYDRLKLALEDLMEDWEKRQTDLEAARRELME